MAAPPAREMAMRERKSCCCFLCALDWDDATAMREEAVRCARKSARDDTALLHLGIDRGILRESMLKEV